MKQKSESLDNLTPSLAIRLQELSASEAPSVEGMSDEEFDAFCKTQSIHVSENAEKKFASVLEGAEARLRLEKAKAKLATKNDRQGIVEVLRTQIASLSMAEVIQQLKDRLTCPGLPVGVYARNLESATEEDLRSMLLDLDRNKPHDETRDDQGPRDSF